MGPYGEVIVISPFPPNNPIFLTVTPSSTTTKKPLCLTGLFCVLLCLFLVEIHADDGVDYKNKYCDPYRPGLTPDQAKAAMDVCFTIFMNERDYRPDNRRAVIERVCITFLLNTSTAVVRQFYLHHIKDIIGIIEAKQAKVVVCNHLLCELH